MMPECCLAQVSLPREWFPSREKLVPSNAQGALFVPPLASGAPGSFANSSKLPPQAPSLTQTFRSGTSVLGWPVPAPRKHCPLWLPLGLAWSQYG